MTGYVSSLHQRYQGSDEKVTAISPPMVVVDKLGDYIAVDGTLKSSGNGAS